VAAVLIALLAGYDRWTYRPRPTHDSGRFGERNARVVHIADGDTIDVDLPDGSKAVTRIRLWGVDTPELRGGSAGPMHFAKEARDFAVQVLDGRQVRLGVVADDTRDRYGRLLAYVYVEPEGRMFNEMLIEEGFGYADRRFPHPHRDRFVELESQARSERAGLWREGSVDDMPKWRQQVEKRRKKRDSP